MIDSLLSANDLTHVRGGVAGVAQFRQFQQNYFFLRFDRNLGRLEALRGATGWF